MNMRTFSSRKLWRDTMIERMEQQHGSVIKWRSLNDAEFDEQLRAKLTEEAEEVARTQSRSELIAELADVFEVIDALTKVHNITKDEILQTQNKKREERGGFERRQFVETVQHKVGSVGEAYCLAEPTKYPEIIEL